MYRAHHLLALATRRRSRTWDPVWGAGNNALQVPIMNFKKLLGISHPTDETAVGTLSGGQVTDLSCAPPIYRPNRNPTTYTGYFRYRKIKQNMNTKRR